MGHLPHEGRRDEPFFMRRGDSTLALEEGARVLQREKRTRKRYGAEAQRQGGHPGKAKWLRGHRAVSAEAAGEGRSGFPSASRVTVCTTAVGQAPTSHLCPSQLTGLDFQLYIRESPLGY